MVYFILMGLLHLGVFVLTALVLADLANQRQEQRGTFLGRVRRLGLFFGLLLVFGSISNGLWSCLVWGRLYVSTDYMIDFSPFWPITQRVIDAPFGNRRGALLGVSLFELQIVWLLFAVGTWTATILLYRIICRRPSANKPAAGNTGIAPRLAIDTSCPGVPAPK